MRERVPMRSPVGMMKTEDVQAAITRLPSVGLRYSLDVAEEALADLGRQALPFVAQKIAERAVHEHAHLIERSVVAYLEDRTWAEPIMREALQDVAREHFKGWLDGIRKLMEADNA